MFWHVLKWSYIILTTLAALAILWRQGRSGVPRAAMLVIPGLMPASMLYEDYMSR